MKRFYREAAAVRGLDGWHVALDGREVRTQGGHVLVLPNEATARLLAAEWDAQGREIDPRGFAMRDLADYALDVVAGDKAAAVAALLRYAETDTLCYRADADEPLWKRQQAVWEPLLEECEAREGIAGLFARVREGETVQFERLGYFAADLDSRPDALVFNRTMTLKDTWAKVQAQAAS